MNQPKRTFNGLTMRRVLCGTLLGLLCWAGQPMAARADVPKPAPAATPEEYTLGVDDVISISAPGHETDIDQDRQIQPDGNIHVKGLDGPIYAVGLTIPQVRDKIFKGLDRLYNNLELSVSLREGNSRVVTITGARSSGRFPLRKNMRVSTLIAQAGGAPSDRLQYVVGNLLRDAVVTKLDIVKILGKEPDPAADLPLEPGDTVMLDLKEQAPPPTYSVLGSVSRGGAFPMPMDGSPISIARAIAEAGGKNEHAALSHVTLQRDGKTELLNLYPLLVEGKADVPEAKINMQDRDILIIPEIKRKYTVQGAVNRSGNFYMPEEKEVRVVDAISEAGGVSPAGEQRKAILMRIVNGKPIRYNINLLDVYQKGKVAQNYVIQDQDVLYIPIRSDNSDPIGKVLNPLYIISNLFNSRLFGF